MKNWQKIPYLPVDTALKEIADLSATLAKTNDLRLKMKLGRRLAFAGSSMAFTTEEVDLANLDGGIAALKLARKVGAKTDDLNRSLAWLTKLRLEKMGCDKFTIVAETKKTVAVDGGGLIAWSALHPPFEVWAGKPAAALAAMNRGEFFLIGMGGDGRYQVVVRVIDAPEPCVSPAEYDKLNSATEIGFLKITQSTLHFGAPDDLKACAKAPAENGVMKVQGFSVGRNGKPILVACAARTLPPPLQEIPELTR